MPHQEDREKRRQAEQCAQAPGPGGKGGVRSGVLRQLLEAQQRERDKILTEVVQIKGFMPLLMKRRNGYRWSRVERSELYEQFMALSHLSPYLIVLLLPGSFLLLPAMAWWLDRRRIQRSLYHLKSRP